MEGNEILQNLRQAFERLMRTRLLISSPSEKVADVPLIYAILLAFCSPWVSAFAFLLGLFRRYSLRVETGLAKRE